MERSIMRTYLRDEIIDILPGEVGFLLEGFLKQEDKDEIIVAPCALMKNVGETCRGSHYLPKLVLSVCLS